MNFKKFFSLSPSQPHHRSVKRIVDINANRKHQNIVAKSQSPFQYKNNVLDKADINNQAIKISDIKAKEVAKQYGLNIDKENKNNSFEKQLKNSGKFLVYTPNKGYYIKTK